MSRFVVVVTVVLLAAQAALACPVCGTAKAPNDWAFGLTTLLLSVLPPAIMAGIVFFLVRAHRRAARDERPLSASVEGAGADAAGQRS